MTVKRILAALFCVLAAACTTMLKVEPITDPQATGYGVVYFLPMVEYEIVLTRQLTRCDAYDSKAPTRKLQVGVKITPTLTTRYVQDPFKAFQLQYDALSGPTKTTDVAIELYENGTLKSINAEAKDETRQILANVVSGLSSLGLAAAGIAPGAKAADDTPERQLCHLAIRNALATFAASEDLISALEETITGLKTEIQDNQRDPAKLKALRAKLAAAEADLAAQLKLRKSVLDRLVDVQVYVVRPTASRQMLPLAPSAGLLSKWFTPGAVAGGDVMAVTTASAAVEAGPATAAAAPSPANSACPAGEERAKVCKPIFYRQPAEGVLRICRGSTCYDASGNPLPATQTLHMAATLVPQLGVLSTLYFANGPFEDNALKVSFRASGGLEKLEAKSKASAREASAAFKETAEALAKFKEQQRKEDVQKLSEETDKLKAEKAKIDAQLELEKSRKALDAYRAQ